MLRLSGWTVGYVIANQIALLVVTDPRQRHRRRPVHLHQRVHVLPAPARPVRGVADDDVHARDGDRRDARRPRRRCACRSRAASGSPRSSIVPAAAMYIALGAPDHRRAAATGLVRRRRCGRCRPTPCVAFSVGLLPFSIYLFALRAFYARHDTCTPFWLNCIENAVNIALAFPLYAWLGIPGLALAFALAYFVAAVVTLGVLRAPARRHRRRAARVVARADRGRRASWSAA